MTDKSVVYQSGCNSEYLFLCNNCGRQSSSTFRLRHILIFSKFFRRTCTFLHSDWNIVRNLWFCLDLGVILQMRRSTQSDLSHYWQGSRNVHHWISLKQITGRKKCCCSSTYFKLKKLRRRLQLCKLLGWLLIRCKFWKFSRHLSKN